MFHCPVGVWVIEQHAIILSATVRSPTVLLLLVVIQWCLSVVTGWHLYTYSGGLVQPHVPSYGSGIYGGCAGVLCVWWVVILQWRHNERGGFSNHQPHDCLLNCLFRRRSKKISKLCVPGLCEGNSPVTGEFPAQRASNAENISIWWRHHISVIVSWHGNIFCIADFVRAIHWASNVELSFFVISLHKPLNELFRCQWFQNIWHSYEVTRVIKFL